MMTLTPQQIVHLQSTYHGSSHRLLLFDYDGTLVDFAPTPPEAVPTPALLRTLQRLVSDAGNTVVIISGRDHQCLDEWFGKLPVTLIAEHGFFIKRPGQDWQTEGTSDMAWKEPVREAMQAAVQAIPKSFIEEKQSALAWHYRMSQDDQAEAAAEDLQDKLKQLQLKGINILPASKSLEVRQDSIDKGTTVSHLLMKGHFDFCLAAGDDVSDEDMFAALPKDAVSIKVRFGPSEAHYYVESPSQLLAALRSLT